MLDEVTDNIKRKSPEKCIVKEENETQNTTIQNMPRIKWANFTYIARQTRTITKLFKKTQTSKLHLTWIIQY